jgi:hypothetical protein
MATGDLKARVLEAARAAPSPTRQSYLLRVRILVVLSLSLAGALFIAFDGPHHGQGRPRWYMTAATAVWCFAALGATWIALAGRGASLRYPRGWLVAAAVGTPVLLLAVMAAFTYAAPELALVHPERVGFKCLGMALAAASLPFVGLTVLRRRSDPVNPVASGAALGAACGTSGGILVELWCPVATTGHVLVGHILPIVVLAVLGALVASRVIALRAPRRR